MAGPKKQHIKLTDRGVKTIASALRKKRTYTTIRVRRRILLDLDECRGKTPTHEQSAKSKGACRAAAADTAAA
jgi:hypothetical protein